MNSSEDSRIQTAGWADQSLRFVQNTLQTPPNDEFNLFIVNIAKFSKPKRILDVGCGGGQWLRQTVSFFDGSTGVGLEPSSDSIKLLQSQYETCNSIGFAQGSAHQIPFPGNSFDLVVAWSVLHWIGRDEYLQALGELVRVSSAHLVIMDFDPLCAYRTPYHHKPGFYTFKHDFEPLVLGSGIMKKVTSARWRMGPDGVELITEEKRSPFAHNPVNWDCRKMVVFSKGYDSLPLLAQADFLEK